MKKLLYVSFLSVSLFTLWFCTSSSSSKEREPVVSVHSNAPGAEFKPVAVLELFTSQGCSSCPSADRLLEAYSHKENVIALSFHVDYWDRLGWKDPYSSSEYTQRQYKYASALNSSVYTPQLVVNGQSEMVGSDASKIDKTLKKIFSQNPNSEISIQAAKFDNGKIAMDYTIAGKSGNSKLNIALVEKKTVTSIKAGENGGVTLNGSNVVRNFMILNKPASGKNSATIEVPAGINRENMSVVLFLQEADNKIIAADQTSITM
ncbi:MAG: DUF1223 domain-containing protein [Bacteroidota bacterium]|nr:DUF1223 domain-containing protein [Bacteroidota bacterium]